MKKRILLLLSIISIGILLNSCSVSNDVASNGIIQKRKYNKGFFLKKKAFKTDTKKQTIKGDYVVFNDQKITDQVSGTIKIQDQANALNLSENSIDKINNYPISSFTDNGHKIKKKTLVKKKLNLTEKYIAKQLVNHDKLLKRDLARKIFIKTGKQLVTSNDEEIDPILLYVLCFLLPPVAVGLVTDWNTNDVILNIILTCLCGLPGIIHALIVVSKNV